MTKKKIVCVCPVSLSKNILFPKKNNKKIVIKKNVSGKRLQGNNLIRFLSNANIAIIGLEKVSKQVIDKLPKLKGVVKYGVGEDNIDINYLKKKKIKYTNTKGVNNVSVAELALSFALIILKKIFINYEIIKRKKKWSREIGFDLRKKKIGIVGLGNVGRETSLIFKKLGCEIYVNDIIDMSKWSKKNKMIFTSLSNIKKKCDVISFHVPLTLKTKNIINNNFLNKCKKSIIIINTSRGGISNLHHIKKFLKKNKGASYATDVFPEEPWKVESIVNLENFYCTPHIGGSTFESINTMANATEKNLIRLIKQTLSK